MEVVRAGVHYPRNWEEFLAWFAEDDECRDYLDWLRWSNGFVCPHCSSPKGWRRVDGRWDCGNCSRIITQTAGTIFDKTRTPLILWFAAAWHMTTQKPTWTSSRFASTGAHREVVVSYSIAGWKGLSRPSPSRIAALSKLANRHAPGCSQHRHQAIAVFGNRSGLPVDRGATSDRALLPYLHGNPPHPESAP